MQLQSFKFKSGELIIYTEIIEYKSTDGKTKLQMSRKYIDGVNKTHFKTLNGLVPQYGFLSSFAGILITVINLFTVEEEIFYTLSGVFLFFGLFLIFGFIFFDGLMGIKITTFICLTLFGEKGYKVSIQNSSGGDNIEFFILNNEKIDVDSIMKYKL